GGMEPVEAEELVAKIHVADVTAQAAVLADVVPPRIPAADLRDVTPPIGPGFDLHPAPPRAGPTAAASRLPGWLAGWQPDIFGGGVMAFCARGRHRRMFQHRSYAARALRTRVACSGSCGAGSLA